MKNSATFFFDIIGIPGFSRDTHLRVEAFVICHSSRICIHEAKTYARIPKILSIIEENEKCADSLFNPD